MASLIQCDRCKNTFPAEAQLYRVTVGSRPKNLSEIFGSSIKSYDICSLCLATLNRILQEAPPSAATS